MEANKTCESSEVHSIWTRLFSREHTIAISGFEAGRTSQNRKEICSYVTRNIAHGNQPFHAVQGNNIAEYCMNHITRINSLYQQNSLFILNFEAGGTYGKSCA